VKLPPLSFVVLDTETTGMFPRINHVIEFASMRVEKGELVDTWEQLIAVDEEVPAIVQVLTRIKPDALKGKPRMEEIQDTLMKKLEGVDLLVGQNLAFDIGMLKGQGIDLSERPWVDTSLLASVVFPEFRSYSLQYMSDNLKLNHEPVHRALGDVRATMELFAKIWERLLQLPPDELAVTKEIMSRTSEGYRIFFDTLPKSVSTSAPWTKPVKRTQKAATTGGITLEKPPIGTVELHEEGLHPGCLQDIVNAAAKDDATMHWIAVKNLEQSLRRLNLPDNVAVIYPPQLLLNPEAAKALAKQKELAPEEGTLLLKMRWFSPKTRADVPVHGNEKDVWNGKLVCAATSPVYTAQFEEKATVFLLDHRQLLGFLSDPAHAAHSSTTLGAGSALTTDAHIIIDDASMLEDTATKAYGHYCSVDDLRAAAKGDKDLTRFTDLLALWAEKTRNTEDLHFFTKGELEHEETKGLQEQLATLLTRTNLPAKTAEQLGEVQSMLDARLLNEHILWVERRNDGTVTLHSAPQQVDELLAKHLYNQYSTTLLVPKDATARLPEIVPAKASVRGVGTEGFTPCIVKISFPVDQTLVAMFENPPSGKSIALVGSKRMIEQLFINHTEKLEEQNVTLICQGMSGGQNRMESEFLAADSPAILLVTPFMYEGMELQEGAADRLFIDTVAFDHPNHAVIGKRKDHYRNGFMEYLLPRATYRLFRLVRTFCRHRAQGAEVTIFDKRLHEKEYGRNLQHYLAKFAENADIIEPPAPIRKSTPKKKSSSAKATEGGPAKNPAVKKEGPQQQLPL